MLTFADIVLGEYGSPRCTRCHRGQTGTLRDTPDILTAIREATSGWSGGPGPNLSFAGAEPFHHHAIFEMLDAAVEAGASRVRLETDAQALVDPGTAMRTLRSGVRHLTVPLLGSTARLHDGLTGSRGSFDNGIAGIKCFTDVVSQESLRTHMTVRVPVCRHNLQDTPQIVTLASKSGANAVNLCIDDADLDLREAGPWLGAACDTGVVYTTWVAVEGVPYGCASGWELHLASLYHKVEGEKSEVCRDCPLTDVCGGAMPGASESVLASFAPPPDAVEASARISRGFEPPEAG